MSRDILESILYFEYVVYGRGKTLRQHQKCVERKAKSSAPSWVPGLHFPSAGESHSFITLYLSRGSLCMYKHQCQLSSKQPAFGMQGRGGHVSDRALLEAVPALSMKIGSPAQQFQLWHSVLKIEIPVCQDGDWRIFINAFLWWPKKGKRNRKKERERK